MSAQGVAEELLEEILQEVEKEDNKNERYIYYLGDFTNAIHAEKMKKSLNTFHQRCDSLPKAKFYDVIDTEGTVLISGFPFSKFKKNVAKIDIWDWN